MNNAQKKSKSKKRKIFKKQNFIETEAEEINSDINDNSAEQVPDLISLDINTNANNDNYDDIISNEPTTVDEDHIKEHRLLFNELNLKKEGEHKRKNIKKKSKIKKIKKKLVLNQIKKNLKSVDNKLDIINTKLNLNIKTNINNEGEERKNEIKNDEFLGKLRIEDEQRRISEFNKKNNTSFIKRIKENDKFINNDFIITSDKIIKKDTKRKLKLFQLKGDILKKY